MRFLCCPLTDGDADVWKDRGASSKHTNAPAELLEPTLTAREDHVSAVHAQLQTRGQITNPSAENPTQEHLLLQSPLHVHNLKNNPATQWKYRRADRNHTCSAHCELLVASVVVLVPEVFDAFLKKKKPSKDLFSARKRTFFEA